MKRIILKYIASLEKGIWLLCLSLLAGGLKAQPASSDEGWFMSPYGRLHVLVVFAEIDFDGAYAQLDPEKKEGTREWPTGEMPVWKDEIISPEPDGDGWMTKYFRQISFGKFQVTGDYNRKLITIPITSIRDANGNVVTKDPYAGSDYRTAVVRGINKLDSTDWAFGSKLKDFDHWGYIGGGYANSEQPDGAIDLIMIVWRNIHVAGLGNNSGFVNHGSIGDLWGRRTNMFSMFRSSKYLPRTIMRHEFSHMLYGGNNFHTAAGGVGARTWMGSIGGWSNMSGGGMCSPAFNGWDRQRMGWKHPEKNHLLSALCAEDRSEVVTDLRYGEALCSGGEYVLRDFVSTGDVIRIELPHLPGDKKKQYIWLENHQRLDGNVDHDKALPPGLYAWLQAGKDLLEGKNIYGGENNYSYPLPAVGSYDFICDIEKNLIHRNSDRENPFTGHHYLMMMPQDVDGDGRIRLTTNITPRTEIFMPADLIIDGSPAPDDYFSYQRYPIFGTTDIPFLPDQNPKMGISYPTAATPLYTHVSPGGPNFNDNRTIYLNGISVEVLSMKDTEVRVKIRWDDFDVVRNVRWCGDIRNMEKVRVASGKTIRLEQGFSPQLSQPVQEIDGEPVYALPTRMTLPAGTDFELGSRAKLIVRKGSTLVIEDGANIVLGRHARIIIEAGAYLEMGENVSIHKKCGGKIEQESGSLQGQNPLLESDGPAEQR